MRTAVIVQARLGSTRYPGKILAKLDGRPVLQHVLERCQKIGMDQVIVACPRDDDPKPVWEIARDLAYVSWPDCAENNVLRRYLLAAKAHGIDLVMRITADCPFIQPHLCRMVLDTYRDGHCRFAAIGWPATFPKGYGCEVFSTADLAFAHQNAFTPYDLEHVTPWMERNLMTEYLTQDTNESHLNYCVDYPRDIGRLEKLQSQGLVA